MARRYNQPILKEISPGCSLEGLMSRGNGNPLQYSCLEKSMDREALWATVPGVAKESDRNEQLNSNLIRTKNMPSSVPDTRQS